MFARPFIDSVDFARNGKEIRGEIAVSALSRLADKLGEIGRFTDLYSKWTSRRRPRHFGSHPARGLYLEVSTFA